MKCKQITTIFVLTIRFDSTFPINARIVYCYKNRKLRAERCVNFFWICLRFSDLFFISFAIGYYFVGSSRNIRDWLIRLRCVGYMTYK